MKRIRDILCMMGILIVSILMMTACGGISPGPTPLQVTITVSVMPLEETHSRIALYGGAVRIDGGLWTDQSQSKTVFLGTYVSLEAQAYEGYQFEGWYEGTTQISSSNPLNFPAVTSRTIRARFVPILYLLQLQAQPLMGGTVYGAGSYPAGSLANIEAIPHSGYQFSYWAENGEPISAEAAHTYTMPAYFVTLTAHFSSISVGSFRALSIGASDYGGEGDLPGAARDSERIRAAFSNQLESFDVQTQTGSMSRSDVIGWLNEYIPGSQAEDLFVFHYSGHGYYNGITSFLHLPSGAISVNDLRTELGKIHGTKLVIIDACESGDFANLAPDESGQDRLDRAIRFNDAVIAAFTEDPEKRGVFGSTYEFYVLTGASITESAWEGGVLNHGYMSFFLTDGMGHTGSSNPMGDFDGTHNADGYGPMGIVDRKLTYPELYNYTRDKVLDWAFPTVQTVQGNHISDAFIVGTF